MKKILFLLCLMGSILTGMGQKVINDPNVEVREAKNFHSINISNAFDVFISQGAEEAVAVSAAETEFRNMIKVEVKDGVLHVSMGKDKWNFKGNKKLKAYISFKKLDRLVVSGACDVFVDGTIKSDELKISLSGASDFKGGKLEVQKLDVDLNGASDATITGSAVQLTVNVSGASEFRGENFSVDYCDAKASGASDIRIKVNKELSVQATGASDVKYKGDGVIKDIRASGASGVRRILL